MTQMTHELCSELLGPFERGELEPDNARDVTEHLGTCDECRAELAGLRALLATDFQPLRDEERAALRTAVATEVHSGGATVRMFPSRRSFWERHAGQIVGAAASLVVILFGVLAVQGLFGGDDGGGGGGQDSAIQEGGALDAAPDLNGPAPVFALVVTEPRSAAAEEDSGGGSGDQAAKRATLLSRASYTEDSLARLGTEGSVFRKFARAYDAAEAAAAGPGFLEQLADAAPDAETAQRVRRCGNELIQGPDPNNAMLPAFASTADVIGRPALILGFVTSTDGAGPLERFSIWALNPETCDLILTSFGDIEGAS